MKEISVAATQFTSTIGIRMMKRSYTANETHGCSRIRMYYESTTNFAVFAHDNLENKLILSTELFILFHLLPPGNRSKDDCRLKTSSYEKQLQHRIEAYSAILSLSLMGFNNALHFRLYSSSRHFNNLICWQSQSHLPV